MWVLRCDKVPTEDDVGRGQVDVEYEIHHCKQFGVAGLPGAYLRRRWAVARKAVSLSLNGRYISSKSEEPGQGQVESPRAH